MGVSGEKLRNFEKRGNAEILIPQFCHSFKFPGDYWLKALLLPSVLHRMQRLLIAEELRTRLIEIGVDENKEDQIYKLDSVYDEKKIEENNLNDSDDEYMDELSPNEFNQALEATKSLRKHHVVRSRAQLMFDPATLPKDPDRDWVNISGPDLDHYAKDQRFQVPQHLVLG